MVERKFRNLKRTFKTICDNRNKPGRGDIVWQYFDLLLTIFHDDRSVIVNNNLIISSLTSTTEQIQTPNTSSLSNSPATTVLKNSHVKTNLFGKNTTPSTTMTPLTSSSATFVRTPTKSEHRPKEGLSNEELLSPAKKPNLPKKKNYRRVRLEAQRRQNTNLETQRLNEFKKLVAAVAESNAIQKERNELFTKFLDKLQ